MKRHLELFVIFLAIAIPIVARGDRGAIIAVEDVDLHEPAQRALIAHNGVEEILILQTDVQASETVKVVEFMPLPSKPIVSLAAEGCFEALQNVIEKYNLRYVLHYRGIDTKSADAQESAVKLVVSEQLGPHQVTVVEVNDVDRFIEWVEVFFKENELGKPNLDDKLREVVKSYLDEEIRFFAFDVITITDEKQTVQPLVYRFKNEELYYPLKVTNLYGGTGTIELLLITPKDTFLTAFSVSMSPASGYGLVDGKITYTCMRTNTTEPNEAELEQIEPSIATFLKNSTSLLSAVKYEGPLVFDEDIKVPISYGWVDNLATRFFKSLDDGDIERLGTLVTVPFAFDRKEVIEDKAILMEKFEEVLQETKNSGISSSIFNITDVKNYQFSDEFNRSFAETYLREYVDEVILAEYQGEQIILLVKKIDNGTYRITGLSD